jgi:hypothetical protein
MVEAELGLALRLVEAEPGLALHMVEALTMYGLLGDEGEDVRCARRL